MYHLPSVMDHILRSSLGSCLAAGTLVLLAAGCAGRSAEVPPPNVILIMADDLGYEVLGANGGLSYETPRLDALAAEGVRFTRAFSTPLCTPSRVQIMTGRYGFRNYVEFGYLDPAEQTFGNLLKHAGYRTAVAGKWQLQLEHDPERPHHFGFDEYVLWQREPGDYWHRFKHPIISGSAAPRDTLFGAYGPDVFVDFIEGFIERHEREHADRPFFVYYPMALVHEPFQPPPGTEGYDSHDVVGLNDTTYFRDMVRYMDVAVGRIVDKLEALDIRGETLVIFTGDNGTDVDVRSRMQSGVVEGGKGLPVKAGTHVPLIASMPGTVRPAVSEALVDFTDFVPTLMDAAGSAVPDSMIVDGVSFFPVLTGKDGATRSWVYCDYDGKDGRFPAGRWAQDERFKLYEDGRFFDYRADPQEQSPLRQEDLSGEGLAAFQKLNRVHERVRSVTSSRVESPI